MRYKDASVDEIVEHFKNSSRAVISSARKKNLVGSEAGNKIEEAYLIYRSEKFANEQGSFSFEHFSEDQIAEYIANKGKVYCERVKRQFVENGKMHVAEKVARAELKMLKKKYEDAVNEVEKLNSEIGLNS